MRIIAGEHRGRRLEAPEGESTRPMLDRVREALFSTLQDLVPEACVLDLYAGTGSLGLEALSRGASRARFLEQDARALKALRANIASLHEEERAEVVRADALDPQQWQVPGEDPLLVFFDPPYPLLKERRTRLELFVALRGLMALPRVQVAVFHTPKDQMLANDLKGDYRVETREYGSSVLWYLWPKARP